MSGHEIAGILTGLIILVAEWTQIVDMLKRKAKPSRSSYWVWTAVQGITAASYYATGGGFAVALPVSSAVMFLVIAILSIRYGEGRWGRLDTACIIGSIASLVLWAASGSAFLALLFLIITDWFGGVTTIRKSIPRPYNEPQLNWALTFLATMTNLFAVGGWTPSDILYNAHMIVLAGTITLLVCRVWFVKVKKDNSGL